jgi:hypothetical protein
MTDEAKAVGEVAITTGKALDVAAKLGGYLSRFVSAPLEQLSGMAEDRLKFMRWENQVRLLSKAESIQESRGMIQATRPVPLNIAIPILQAGSLEENDELQDIWANMLVNAGDVSVDIQFRRAFISIAEDLTFLDKKMLECIYSDLHQDAISLRGLPNAHIVLRVPIDQEKETCQLDRSVEISIQNLARLGIISVGDYMGDDYDSYKCIYQTSLGSEFMKAIQEKPCPTRTA